MPPVNHKRASNIIWDRLQLPTEIIENTLSSLIHDALILAGCFAVSVKEVPQFDPYPHYVPKKSTADSKSSAAIQHVRRVDKVLRFGGILSLCQVCQVYRSAVEGLLGKLLPSALPLSELHNHLSEETRGFSLWKTPAKRIPESLAASGTPALKSIAFLQDIALCCMDLSTTGFSEVSLANCEKLYGTLCEMKAVKETPLAMVYLTHAKLRIEIYQKLEWVEEDDQARIWNADGWQRKFLAKAEQEVLFLSYLQREVTTLEEIHRTCEFFAMLLEAMPTPAERANVFGSSKNLAAKHIMPRLHSLMEDAEHILADVFAMQLKHRLEDYPELENPGHNRLVGYTQREAFTLEDYIKASRYRKPASTDSAKNSEEPAPGVNMFRELLNLKTRAFALAGIIPVVPIEY